MAGSEKADIDPRFLAVELTCSATMDDADPTEKHTRRYKGRLVSRPWDEEKEVGWFAYYDFDVTIRAEEGDPRANSLAFTVMDAETQATYEAFEDIRGNLDQCSDMGWIRRVIYLDRLVVHPRYRGQGIARSWLAWILNQVSFGDPSSTCVALTPFPIEDDGTSLMGKDVPETKQVEIERRKDRLVSLYESAGFKRLGETDTWALCLADNHPDPRNA